MELKFQNGQTYFPEDEGYDALEFKGAPMPPVLIDDADIPLVLSRHWALWDRNGRLSVKHERYVGLGPRCGRQKRSIHVRRTELHRFLFGEPPYRIRALNGNYLDCRRANYAPVRGEK